MQWREYELRRLQQEGLDVSNQAAPPPLQGPPVDPQEGQQHECTPLHEEPEETEQDKAHKVCFCAVMMLHCQVQMLTSALQQEEQHRRLYTAG